MIDIFNTHATAAVRKALSDIDISHSVTVKCGIASSISDVP